ncbi:ABC transporter permease [Nocardioides sp. JQ2195]|uniref:ABC transporter permease n=1 Tax=Nocardioides sp. JQ2195 TaxID=2592334 RepID=UPI00143E5568|nr:ABC transporter permease [Nocardioides sp. JQ2195]QIX26022.1 ABC transporter permease [Nocardioides sp. JQ2195]
MSAGTSTVAAPVAAGDPGYIDISQSRRPSFARLVGVEMRKMTDTRAGLWLLITIGVVTVLVNTLFLIFGDSSELTFLAFLQFSAMPQGMLLPVLAILLVTQEWGQRTGLVTFSLVPHRGRVTVAKLAAAVLFVLAAFVVAFVVALVLTPIAGATDPWQDVTVAYLSRVVLALLLGAVWGFAFGAALLNSAFAIVAYFAVPTVISIVTSIWATMQDKLLWFDLQSSSSQLFNPDGMSGEQWAQVGTGVLIWIVLPLAIGVWRITRTEIK